MFEAAEKGSSSGCKWGRIEFVRPKEEDVIVAEMQDDEILDKNFSCVGGEQRPYIRYAMQEESPGLDTLGCEELETRPSIK